VCRPNTRLGNTLLLTPLVLEIEASLPGARVDLLTACADAEPIFRTFGLIGQIHQLPLRGARHPLAHLATLARARAARYDLVIDPCPTSWSARFAMGLMRGRRKIGFSSPFKSRGTHLSVPIETAPQHMAHYPVYLLRRAVLGLPPAAAQAAFPGLSIRLSEAERAAGAELLERVCARRAGCPRIAIAAAATGNKRYAAAWWHTLLSALGRALPASAFLEIRPPSGSGSFAQYPGYSSPDVRRVAALINAADYFICADSGLMHLGAATATTTFGLFKVTAAAMYEPYGGRNAAIPALDDAPELAAQRIAERILEPGVVPAG
jgi:heptosyltransferase III